MTPFCLFTHSVLLPWLVYPHDTIWLVCTDMLPLTSVHTWYYLTDVHSHVTLNLCTHMILSDLCTLTCYHWLVYTHDLCTHICYHWLINKHTNMLPLMCVHLLHLTCIYTVHIKSLNVPSLNISPLNIKSLNIPITKRPTHKTSHHKCVLSTVLHSCNVHCPCLTLSLGVSVLSPVIPDKVYLLTWTPWVVSTPRPCPSCSPWARTWRAWRANSWHTPSPAHSAHG